MNRIVALFAASALALACGAAQKSGMSSPAASEPPPPSGAAPIPGDPKAEIDALDAQITQQLAELGLATSEPAACAANQSCTADPMSLAPRIEDPTCKPATNDTCNQACTLSDSVCVSAGRICELAKQLGGADADANAKCQRGNDACTRSRERCCGCT